MNNKKIITLLIMFTIIFTLLGGTFAYWNWQSEVSKNVVFKTSKGMENYIIYDEGTSHFVGNFQPSTDHCGGISSTIAFLKTAEASNINLVATINMDVNSIGENIRNSDYVKWAITSGNSDSCSSTVLNSGTFKNVEDNTKITLQTDISLDIFTDEQGNAISKSTADTMLNPNNELYSTNLAYFRENANSKGNMFTIWIWIDESGDNLSSLSGETIDANIWTFIDMAPEEYTITFDSNGGEIATAFTTVGETQYTVPLDGTYKIELWGAQGGSVYGYGGYTSGTISFVKEDLLYFNIGGEGVATDGTGEGGYNGGGSTLATSSGKRGPTGGGATDVRYLNNTLNDRIMVAGGGGGHANDANYANAGGLIGYDGAATDYKHYVYIGKGASQVAGGAIPTQYSGTMSNGTAGTFGQGGTGGASKSDTDTGGGAGGGGGYYGGSGASGLLSGSFGAGGGSSFISGHTGCVAITSESDVTPKSGCTTGSTDNSCSLHYSGKSFTDTLMIDGSGYKWTTSKGSLQQIPNPNGGYYDSGVGHTGNGAAKITLLSGPKTVTNGLTYGELPTPIRENYTFLGWNTKSDGSGTTITSSAIVNLSEDTTLYAIWGYSGPGNVIIKYNVNGGTIASSTTDTDGTTIYNWSTDTDGNILLNNNILTTTISYGGQTSSDGLNNYNNSTYINITKTGYSAPSGAQWICESGCTVSNKTYDQGTVYSDSDFCDASHGDCIVVVKVNWKQTYTVSYNANGGSGAPSAQTKYHDTTLTLSSTVPTKSGYVFLGWSTSSSATSPTYKAGGNYTENAAATLYAVWGTTTTTTGNITYKFLNENIGEYDSGSWLNEDYSITYNPATNQSTVTFTSVSIRLGFSESTSYTFSASLSIKATDSGKSASTSISISGTHGSGYYLHYDNPSPRTITVQHSNTTGSKSVTISASSRLIGDWTKTGSGSATHTVGTYQG